MLPIYHQHLNLPLWTGWRPPSRSPPCTPCSCSDRHLLVFITFLFVFNDCRKWTNCRATHILRIGDNIVWTASRAQLCSRYVDRLALTIWRLISIPPSPPSPHTNTHVLELIHSHTYIQRRRKYRWNLRGLLAPKTPWTPEGFHRRLVPLAPEDIPLPSYGSSWLLRGSLGCEVLTFIDGWFYGGKINGDVDNRPTDQPTDRVNIGQSASGSWNFRVLTNLRPSWDLADLY